MKRSLRASTLFGAVCCLLACGNESPPGPAAAGMAGAATGGAGASNGGSSAAGASGSPSTSAGSGGQSAGGSGNSAGAGAGNAGSPAMGGAGAGAGAGGSAGNGGSAGSGGSAGAGGSGSMLPKRVLLYHFSTLTIGTVAAQLTFYKNQLMTWGYETVDSVNPDDISTANLATFGAVGMINTCFEPFGMGKPGDAQAAALKAFVQAGGGLFGTHCADVTFTSAATMPAYNQLLGGWAHNGQNSGDNGSLMCTKKADHPTSMMLPATFSYQGNVDVAEVAKDATVLVECKYGNTTTPVSWVRTETGGGRVFYTSFGKVDADLTNTTIGPNHIVLGLGWVLGR
jgi:hypothetical protein